MVFMEATMTKREWIDYPKDIEIETQFGPVFLSIVQGDYVYVDGQSNGKFITVAGKKYTIALRLHCYDGSTWELTKDKYGSTRDGISSGVWQSYKAFDRMPPSYEKKAVAEIIAQVSDYLKGHPFQRAQGAYADANNELARAEEKLAELEAQVAEQARIVREAQLKFKQAELALTKSPFSKP
jgi:hypothetical protein